MPTHEEQWEHLRSRIEVAVLGGYIDEKEILAHAEEDLEEGSSEHESLPSYARRLLDEQRAAEARWTEPTVNDAITRAFDELNSRGIVALENAGYTKSEGWEDVGNVAKYSYEPMRGATFFHGQDVERGVLGAGLWLAFGALDADGNPSDDDAASLAIAHEVRETLARHGVPTEWNGSVEQRIHIPPFDWRKRRWTQAAQKSPPPTRFSCERVIQGAMHERGVSREDAIAALEGFFSDMARKHYGAQFAFEAHYDPEQDRVEIFRTITAVEQRSDDPAVAVNERFCSQLNAVLKGGIEPGDELIFQVFYLKDDDYLAQAQDEQYARLLDMETDRRFMELPTVRAVRQGVLEQLRAMGR
ncbi:hypothetical protein HPC49_19215 [Pyxidicoccus fallax]|uniref:Uncharacterized protein n=1 Tax=Pyxidicoccus fallax TaxID=394095 RepID=A0A848LK65_9BACT|nr:NusA N-terminal domain-containing protein [Pyxidicoccus fallax]NMO18098.1 hypothetical protein [Pyxidicoccus fallax]NPC80342.1 hypothetical protein [Pyxidicoccus fallax]